MIPAVLWILVEGINNNNLLRKRHQLAVTDTRRGCEKLDNEPQSHMVGI